MLRTTGIWRHSPKDSGHLSIPRGRVGLESEDEEVCGGHVLVGLHLNKVLFSDRRVLVYYHDHTPSEEPKEANININYSNAIV